MRRELSYYEGQALESIVKSDAAAITARIIHEQGTRDGVKDEKALLKGLVKAATALHGEIIPGRGVLRKALRGEGISSDSRGFLSIALKRFCDVDLYEEWTGSLRELRTNAGID